MKKMSRKTAEIYLKVCKKKPKTPIDYLSIVERLTGKASCSLCYEFRGNVNDCPAKEIFLIYASCGVGTPCHIVRDKFIEKATTRDWKTLAKRIRRRIK